MEDTSNSEQPSDRASKVAGIVLCGGKSLRMGRSKADLVFGSETLLERVVRILQEVVDHVVVVAAADQTLPDLGENVTSAQDSVEFGGPLLGLETGLRAVEELPQDFSGAYVTSCDTPFLQPDFVKELIRQIEKYDVAVPKDEKYFHTLAAAYRISLRTSVSKLIEQGERRPRALFPLCNTLAIPTSSLTSVDPQLRSLVNLNTPADYRAALESAELAIPSWLDELSKD